MINECGKKGMKPLCDHPSYCKADLRAVYIGQDNHMAYPLHRNTESYFPSGWSELEQQFPQEFAPSQAHMVVHPSLCAQMWVRMVGIT